MRNPFNNPIFVFNSKLIVPCFDVSTLVTMEPFFLSSMKRFCNSFDILYYGFALIPKL